MRLLSISFLLFCAIATVLAASSTKKKTVTTKRSAVKKSSSTSSSSSYGDHRLITYVVDWEVPESISWDKLDHIAYAFAEPNSKGDLESFTASNLKSVVSEAHKNKVGVSISVGGWTGSKYFSSLVKSSSTRSTLVNNIVSMVETYKLDGVNIDWEYPNDPNGVSCNEKNSADTANYLLFVKALREKLDKNYPSVHKLITLAVGTNVFNDANQTPIKKLDTNWAKYVDSFYLMTYDISGSWDTNSGPNAPLKASSKYDSSVAQSVEAWSDAGIPKSQLVVGVPFYGTVLKTSKVVSASSGPYVKLASSSSVQGDKYDEKSADDCPGAVASYSGGYQWRSIVSDGISKNKNGWKSYWDSTSSTPYAYQSSSRKYLSFDNATSLKDKASYVTEQKLGGIMIWSLEMDDSSNTLLASLQSVRK